MQKLIIPIFLLIGFFFFRVSLVKADVWNCTPGGVDICEEGTYCCNMAGGGGDPQCSHCSCCLVGSGGGNCVVCYFHTACRKTGSGARGAWCGWSNTRPIQPKYLYRVSDGCVNTCENTCTPNCTDYNGTKDDGCGGTCPCVEEGPYYGDWSVCDENHKQTRTVTTDCGTPSVVETQDCVGTITGTLFDASNMSNCPADIGTNPIYSSLRFGNQSFDITGTTWPVISPPVSTDADGNYSESVYASAINGSYSLGFTDLYSSGKATGIKINCNPATMVTDNEQVLVKNVGFWRSFGSWWQVKDSDVQSAGDLISDVPDLTGTVFNLTGPGGFPGVAAYGTSTSLTSANVSNTGWLANSTVTNARVYNYDYFVNQIPSDILAILNDVNIVDVAGSLASGGTHDANNYYWYKYDGMTHGNQPLTIPATNIGGRKVILLVDNANVNITGNINLTDGQGFFMLVVKGDININSAVGGGVSPNLEGLYFADGMLNDNVGDTQLSTRGSTVANGGIRMQRDLGIDNTQPAEFFEFAPDQIMLFPKVFGTRRMNWKEVAP